MSFTRFHDDPARVKKANIETSAINDYVFNVPGNLSGARSHFYEDPRIRLQKTGMGQHTNMIGVESMLRNQNRPLVRDNAELHTYEKYNVPHKQIYSVENNNNITSESRASHPAFEYRELAQHRPHVLLHDPQRHVFRPFEHNLDTNILEKDYYNLKTYKKI